MKFKNKNFTIYYNWFDGTDWKEAQQKTKVQQEPLFNIQDGSHTSFSDSTSYPSSNFVGNKLFT